MLQCKAAIRDKVLMAGASDQAWMFSAWKVILFSVIVQIISTSKRVCHPWLSKYVQVKAGGEKCSKSCGHFLSAVLWADLFKSVLSQCVQGSLAKVQIVHRVMLCCEQYMLCCSASLLPMQLPGVSLHANSVLLCSPALQGRNPLKPFRMRSAQSSDKLQPQLLSCHCWRHHVSNYSFSLPCWKRCFSSVLDLDNWRVTNFSQTRHQVRSISLSTQTRTWRSLKSGWSQGHRSLPNQKKCVYAPSPPPSTRWTAWWRTRGPTRFKVPCPHHELYVAPTVEETVDFTLPYPTCLLFPHFENTDP